ncbi:Rib/alpha-like domain-containing protein, partial [Lonepinella sp. BR2271]|uniref:Rib/alpha-like domain-containing protein n=1 Tax=Lonepinella sp. BR2271 TaxID=3434550 RepID=UPI003F6E21B2
MSVLLKVKTQGNTQTVEVAKNVANQAVKIQHVGGNAVYELLDQDTGVAPQQIVTKRVGDDLHITFQNSQDEDLIIADYYNDPALIQGLAENGQYYAYIPANSESASAIAALNDSMLATEVLGGEAIVAGYLPHWGWIAAGVAAIAGIAIAASSGSSSGSSSSTNPSSPNGSGAGTTAEKTEPNPPEVIAVKDPANLTPEEKKAVEEAVKKANPDFPEGTTVTVADNGEVTVTYPDGSTDTIAPEKAADKAPITDYTEPKDPETTPVKDPANLTPDEKTAVEEAVKKANPDFPEGTKVEVGTDGTVTVTYPDGSTDKIPATTAVSKASITDYTTPVDPDATPVKDPANLTPEEKEKVIEA